MQHAKRRVTVKRNWGFKFADKTKCNPKTNLNTGLGNRRMTTTRRDLGKTKNENRISEIIDYVNRKKGLNLAKMEK